MLLEPTKVSDSFSREIRFGDCPSSSGNGLWGLGRGGGGALLGQGRRNNVEYIYIYIALYRRRGGSALLGTMWNIDIRDPWCSSHLACFCQCSMSFSIIVVMIY